MFWNHGNDRPVRRRIIGALLLALAAAACDEGPTALDDELGNFLIRNPTDVAISSSVPSFTASPSSTDSIDFEWEPAPGADRYAIVFERVPTRAQMDTLGATIAEPTFAIPVDAPRIEEVRLGSPPDEGEEDHRRVIRVVAYAVPLDDLAGVLEEAGLPAGDDLFFVWSVVAYAGDRSARSIELQRMILRRETG